MSETDEIPPSDGDYEAIKAMMLWPVISKTAEAFTRSMKKHNLLEGTEEFMRLANQLGTPIFDDITDWSDADRNLRIELLREEYHEYRSAEHNNDVVEIVDGLLDIIVIAWGTLLAYIGPDKAKAAAAEVVRSNLSKVDGSLGPTRFREDGKVIKPEGWTPPDIEGAIS